MHHTERRDHEAPCRVQNVEVDQQERESCPLEICKNVFLVDFNEAHDKKNIGTIKRKRFFILIDYSLL